jgi:hypothetical protein
VRSISIETLAGEPPLLPDRVEWRAKTAGVKPAARKNCATKRCHKKD